MIRYVDRGTRFGFLRHWSHTFEVEDDQLPRSFRLHHPEYDAVVAWCTETFGTHWYANQAEDRRRWRASRDAIYFTRPLDALAFKIRWG